ncbi:MAG: hypothetical protein OCD03_07885 [Hyphomicrobiales bacterium]
MIKNVTMVQIFLRHFYNQRVEKLEDFVSPNFSYQSPAIAPVDFLAFISHCDDLFQNVSVGIEQIKTQNDRIFQIFYSINIWHKNASKPHSLPGRANILVVNNLIENIIVSYDPNLLVGNKSKNKQVFLFD